MLLAQATPASPTEQFLQSGLLGAAVVVLAAVIVYLHSRNERLRDAHAKETEALWEAHRRELRELRDKLEQEHRARLDDARQNTVTLLEVHDRQNAAIETLDRALDTIQRLPQRR